MLRLPSSPFSIFHHSFLSLSPSRQIFDVEAVPDPINIAYSPLPLDLHQASSCVCVRACVSARTR